MLRALEAIFNDLDDHDYWQVVNWAAGGCQWSLVEWLQAEKADRRERRRLKVQGMSEARISEAMLRREGRSEIEIMYEMERWERSQAAKLAGQ